MHMQRDSDLKKSAMKGMCARGMWQVRQGMAQVQREGGRWGRESQVQREWTGESDGSDAKGAGR